MPKAIGEAQATGGNLKRRRTINAGHRKRAYVQAQLQMFDEPSLGLSPILVRDIFNVIKRIKAEGTTVLIVGQKVNRHSTSPTGLIFWKTER